VGRISKDNQSKMQTMTDDVVNKGDGMNSATHSKPARIGGRSAPLVEFITTCIDDSKGEEIVSIDLEGKTAIADAMIIASGRSRRHVGAIADKLIKTLKEKGHKGLKVEGQSTGEWVLLDIGDVIVHIFQPEIRDFYNLEKMWSAERPDIRPV
jgi:ribosome-associated protein